jgi:PIN domain nuclease of toxin-antitoxin system
MNYLLDTHTLIWAITEDEKLSKLVTVTLKDTQNTIFVSALTFWEISLKYSINKLNLENIKPNDFLELSLQSRFQLIPVSPGESATYHNLIATTHKDPFDRMLIWQAIQRNLIFITMNKNLNQYQDAGLKTLW